MIDVFINWLVSALTPPPAPEDMMYCPHCGGTGYDKLWTPCQYCGTTGYISKYSKLSMEDKE